MQATHDLSSTLNHLIEVCRDGENGFEVAARAVEDSLLRAELNQYSLQRKEYAAELKTAFTSLGEPVQDGGSVAGSLHRGWMNLKAAISGHKPYAILAECERGEDAAVQAYREALASDLPHNLETLVESQYDQVWRIHDRIKELRDAARPN